ncbi:MAG TPA: TonB-dependent receptor [Bryobacteraceae bacterium]|nr:TonB-dependent receptor [Bryobacteraceae bacterium]
MPRYLCLLLLVSTSTPLLTAQIGATAQLSGELTDPSGRVVANQTITVRNPESGQTRSAETSSDGQYEVLDLAPGRYEISAAAPGFAPLHVPLELNVNQQAIVNLHFQLAQQRQEANVTGTPEVIEPTRTELSQVVAEREIENLPINGRQFLDFVLLTPNVYTGRTNISNPSSPGEPQQVDLSFAGLHESTSMILVDGANNMNRVFGRSRSAPSEEAVQEFRVLNDNYPPSLGPAAGGVVNIVTRSGANDLHGSLYEYFRNNGMDARNILAPAGFDELRQNQFGATLGGKLIQDKLFYFVNYEGQRREESPFYSSILLNNLTAINRALAGFGLAPEVLAGKLRQTNYDETLARLDYAASEREQMSFEYRFRADRDTNLPAATGQLSAPSDFRNATIDDHDAIWNLTSTLSPRLLNQALVQFAHRAFDFPPVSYEPQLEIANTLDFGRHFNAINADQEARVEFADSLSYVRGSHTFTFGGDFSYDHIGFFYDPFDPAYAVFPNLSAFLGIAPFAGPFAVTFGFSEAPDGTRPPAPPGFAGPANLPIFNAQTHPDNASQSYALYAQDQWRVTKKLTLNYGLRWDLDHMPPRYFDTYYKNFGPRAGVAYSLLNDRMIVRAGAGRYQGEAYSVPYLIAMVAGEDSDFGLVRANEDYSVSTNTLHSPFYSNPAVATSTLLQFLKTGDYPVLNPANFSPAQQFISTIKRFNHGGPFSYQWNGQVDFQIGHTTTLSVSYFGLRGLFLPSAIGGNVGPTNLTLPDGRANYAIAPGSTVARTLNPLISPLSFFYDASGQSSYQSGTATLNKRFSRYYSFTGNYTWSHTIDSGGDPSLNGTPQDAYRRNLEKANSKQDVPQRFVALLDAETPERGWFRNFRFALIETAQAASFYTVFAGTDVNHDGNANTDRLGLLGRDTYRGDALVNLDVRLARMFRFNERFNAELLAEAFNITNTLNVTDINTVYGAADPVGPIPQHFGDGTPAPLSSFGSIRATNAPRQIQLAVRIKF